MSISSALNVPSGGKAQRTYRTLVAATRATLAETGRFSGDSVAERAGMAPATFYAYFPSKDEALAAALDDVLTEAVDAAMGHLSVVNLLERGLRPIISDAVDATLGVFTGSAAVMRLALARLPDSRTIRQVYREHETHAVAELERFVLHGVAAGQLKPADPAAATTALLVTLQGLNNPILTHRKGNGAAIGSIVDMLEALLSGAASSSFSE